MVGGSSSDAVLSDALGDRGSVSTVGSGYSSYKKSCVEKSSMRLPSGRSYGGHSFPTGIFSRMGLDLWDDDEKLKFRRGTSGKRSEDLWH